MKQSHVINFCFFSTAWFRNATSSNHLTYPLILVNFFFFFCIYISAQQVQLSTLTQTSSIPATQWTWDEQCQTDGCIHVAIYCRSRVYRRPALGTEGQLILCDPITLKCIYHQILAQSLASFKTEWLSGSASGKPAASPAINTVGSARWKYLHIRRNAVHFFPQTYCLSSQCFLVLPVCHLSKQTNKKKNLEAAEKCCILSSISKYQNGGRGGLWRAQLWMMFAHAHTNATGFMFCINEKWGLEGNGHWALQSISPLPVRLRGDH